ncbi:MAG: BlaI/MecI/CopY family transcriptional regulator [Crocinitomicaceae bacterium]
MKKELTKAEEQIMQAIWSVEKGFAKDILEAMNEPKPAYNTVLTVIRVLVKKGFVKYKTYGKSNEYYPTISKEDYSNQQLKSLQKKYFNNSPKELLSFFVKENELDIGQLDELLRQIKEDKKS